MIRFEIKNNLLLFLQVNATTTSQSEQHKNVIAEYGSIECVCVWMQFTCVIYTRRERSSLGQLIRPVFDFFSALRLCYPNNICLIHFFSSRHYHQRCCYCCYCCRCHRCRTRYFVAFCKCKTKTVHKYLWVKMGDFFSFCLYVCTTPYHVIQCLFFSLLYSRCVLFCRWKKTRTTKYGVCLCIRVFFLFFTVCVCVRVHMYVHMYILM